MNKTDGQVGAAELAGIILHAQDEITLMAARPNKTKADERNLMHKVQLARLARVALAQEQAGIEWRL